jgi:hypothetical protein
VNRRQKKPRLIGASRSIPPEVVPTNADDSPAVADAEKTIGARSPVHRPRSSICPEWIWWILLLGVVTVLWCSAYNRWTARAWKVPIIYQGDAWQMMGMAKAFASGEVKPLLPKHVSSLGAPFIANWSDYPTGEALFDWYGLLARLFGFFVGSNLTVLSAHLLAAASFYFVTRQLGYRSILGMAGAVLFSMSHFAFARQLAHLWPLFYWHVPLGLLVAWWCGREVTILNDPKKIIFCFAVAIVHGLQDPYYAGIFLQFLGFACLASFIRRDPWRRVLFPVGLAVVVLGTNALTMVSFFYNKSVNGSNSEAFTRSYGGLELYALKPLELLMPFPHRIAFLQVWSHKAYVTQATLVGEVGAPYLGIVAIVGLCALVWSALRSVAVKKAADVPLHFWGVLWVLCYSVVGGFNGLLGVFGIILFRGTNRYSIVILALALLFLVRQLSSLARSWHWLTVTVLACITGLVGFWDQSPRPPSLSDINIIRQQVLSDGEFVSALEERLPPRAMIFELPIMGFPEVGPIHNMQDYEHFRPYLQSHSLRFSYGNVKGRPREQWQKDAEHLGPAYLATTLENYGFAAILINKKAYEDNAAALLAALRAAGRTNIISESSDLVGIALHPAVQPTLPPEFDQHWYGLEGDANDNWRWSGGDATIVLYNMEMTAKPLHLSFYLGTVRGRTVEISSGGQKLETHSLVANETPVLVELTVRLSPGKNEIHFTTDTPADLAGNGDPRRLAFNIRNLQIAN